MSVVKGGEGKGGRRRGRTSQIANLMVVMVQCTHLALIPSHTLTLYSPFLTSSPLTLVLF